jgi:hypothetical protein
MFATSGKLCRKAARQVVHERVELVEDRDIHVTEPGDRRTSGHSAVGTEAT